MPTALLAGAFGQHNPGDEALLDAFVRALPGWRHVATSSDPQATRARGVEAVPSWNVAKVAGAARRADAVIFAGGTVFKALDPRVGRPRNDLLLKALLLAAGSKAQGKPLAMIGLGVGDLPGRAASVLARALVRLPDLLVLRDEESAEELRRAGAPMPFRVGADPAWTLVDAPPEAHDNGSDTVVIALSSLCGGRDLGDRLAKALEPLARVGDLRLQLQPWQIEGRLSDAPLARDLQARLGGRAEILPPPRDLAAARSLFSTAHLVLGLRFHALLAAASAGVPFVALAHEAKLAALARRLHQPAVAPGEPPERLTEALVAASGGSPPSPAAVRAEIARAEESFRLMRLLLSGGRSPEVAEVSGLPLVPEPSPR
jgi:polysaccharide pyruvyl transferase WcaK-like protein